MHRYGQMKKPRDVQKAETFKTEGGAADIFKASGGGAHTVHEGKVARGEVKREI